MPAKPPDANVLMRWHAAVSDAEAAAMVGSARRLCIRLVALGTIAAYLAAGPLMTMLAVIDPRPMSTALHILMRALLAIFVLMYPAMSVWNWALIRRAAAESRADLPGTLYVISKDRIRRRRRWSADWTDLTSFRETTAADGVPSVQLIDRRGFHRQLVLPNDTKQARRVIALLAERLPRYDPITHGPIDGDDTVPIWVSVSLVLGTLAFIVCFAIGGDRLPALLRGGLPGPQARQLAAITLVFGAPFVVVWVWHVCFARRLSLLQWERLRPFLLPAYYIMVFGAVLSLAIPFTARAFRDIAIEPTAPAATPTHGHTGR